MSLIECFERYQNIEQVFHFHSELAEVRTQQNNTKMSLKHP